MTTPIVIVASGGLPVINTPSGISMTVATNGVGVPVTIVTNGFGVAANLIGYCATTFDPAHGAVWRVSICERSAPAVRLLELAMRTALSRCSHQHSNVSFHT
jgi:hypothetical protein